MKPRSQPQWIVSGIVEAPVEKVWRDTLENTPWLTAADKKAVSQGENAPFYSPTSAKVEVDTEHHSIALQGGWWYSGVHSIETHERGSRIVYKIYNVAPGLGWWIAQFIQGPQATRNMEQTFQKQLSEMANRLHCKAYLSS
jgi:hypothetical protein